MVNVVINDEKNGVEVRFDSKPDEAVLDVLRSNGFHWSNKQKMWYAKQTPERMAIVSDLFSGDCKKHPCGGSSITIKNKSEKPQNYDLWEMTRIDEIGNNFAKYKIYDTREIAAIVRKHIKPRFPMCKFSVKSDHNSIDVDLLASPFAKDSDELKAIVHYVYMFVESYNYDNSDSMTDYFDVNFYFSSERNIISYSYEQTETTVSDANISAAFQEKKAEHETAERERAEREYQERKKQIEIDREESVKREAIRKENHAKIEANAVVKNLSFFVMNCYDKVEENDGSFSKNSRCNCKVQKAVYLTKELYDMLLTMMVSDFSFYENMGGSYTDDQRIVSFLDFEKMSEEERKTVEWYNTSCVAIYCDGELMMVVDPQGHGYAKYVYYMDDESSIIDKYVTYLGGLSAEEHRENRELARIITDISTQIIEENGWHDTWNNANFKEYKTIIKAWIYEHNFKLSVGVARAIQDGYLKEVVYRLLTEVDGIREQFDRAEFEEGQKVTIIQINDFGGMSVGHVLFKSYMFGEYAQYRDAVKMVFRPERKRNDYYKWFYNEVIIVDGWVDLPESLLWETSVSNGMVCKKTKFLSCDRKQYDVILEYLKEQNANVLVNTYKPQF